VGTVLTESPPGRGSVGCLARGDGDWGGLTVQSIVGGPEQKKKKKKEGTTGRGQLRKDPQGEVTWKTTKGNRIRKKNHKIVLSSGEERGGGAQDAKRAINGEKTPPFKNPKGINLVRKVHLFVARPKKHPLRKRPHKADLAEGSERGPRLENVQEWGNCQMGWGKKKIKGQTKEASRRGKRDTKEVVRRNEGII